MRLFVGPGPAAEVKLPFCSVEQQIFSEKVANCVAGNPAEAFLWSLAIVILHSHAEYGQADTLSSTSNRRQ